MAKPSAIRQASPERMDWEPSTRVAYGSGPRQARGAKPPAKWVSKDVLEKRRAGRQCLRCGDSTHYVDSCKYGPARRPTEDVTPRRVGGVTEVKQGTSRKGKPKAVELTSSNNKIESDSGNK